MLSIIDNNDGKQKYGFISVLAILEIIVDFYTQWKRETLLFFYSTQKMYTPIVIL